MRTAAKDPGEGRGRLMNRGNSITTDLFPESLLPVPAAIWPTPGTRAAEALAALLTGPINQADYSDGWRLSASVKTLKYDGWAILSRPIWRPGCRREIAEYVLDRHDPATAAALAQSGVK